MTENATLIRTQNAQIPWTNLRYLTSAFVLILLIFLVVAYWISTDLIRDKLEQQQQHWIHHSQIIASSKDQMIAQTQRQYADIAYSLARYELIQIILSEISLSETNLADKSPAGLSPNLQAQLPYLQVLLSDFTNNNQLLKTAITTHNAHLFASSETSKTGNSEPITLAQQAIQGADFQVEIPTISEDKLLIEIAVPVHRAQLTDQQPDPIAVGAVIIQFDATQLFGQILQPLPLSDPQQSTYLLHPDANGQLQRLSVDTDANARYLPSHFNRITQLPTQASDWLIINDGENDQFSLFLTSDKHQWVIQQNVTVAHALQEFRQFRGNVWIANLFVFAVLLLAGIIVWRNAVAMRDHALANQYKKYAADMEDQQLLRSSIINSITDSIGVKDDQGRYFLGNAAFVALSGQRVDSRTLTEENLFSGPALNKLLAVDERVQRDHQARKIDIDIDTEGGQRKHLSSLRVPFKDHLHQYRGIVSITRDVTESVIAKQKIDRAVRATVDALSLAVEQKDPYFAGHSKRTSYLAAQLAESLRLSASQVATCRLASDLLGIKVLTAPPGLLEKHDQLSATEIDEIYLSLDRFLEGVHFTLPVQETIHQLNERADNALPIEQTLITTQVVKIADAYHAMLSPRSYHTTVSSSQAITTMRNQPTRFSPKIVDTLQQICEEQRTSALE